MQIYILSLPLCLENSLVWLIIQPKWILTECLLDQMFQSVSHIGWTRRRILYSRHNLFLDGVDDKQESV